MYIFIIYRKEKKIGKHLAYLAYIFNAFFFFLGFGRTGGRTGGFVSVGDWSSPGNISKVVSQRSRAIVSDDLGFINAPVI